MTNETNPPLAVAPTAELGLVLEDAAAECLMALAGVDTYGVNLRDHQEAWVAIEAFAAKVRAAERERLRAALEWYADEARACAKNSHKGNHAALLASMTVLALDGGRRADEALKA